MPRTPTQSALSIVSPETTGGRPPRDLGQHGRELWDAVQREYGITDRGGIELLAQACGALDLVEALGEAIARDGAIVYGRAGPKAHPAVKDQIAARAFIVRTLERLGLNVDGRQVRSRTAAERLRLGRGMSGTRRTPLDRTSAVQITPRALDLYVAMGKLRCTCAPPPPEYWKRKMCPGCERWYGLHGDLHEELRCEPWEWPCVAQQSPKRAGSTCWNDEIAARMAMLEAAVRRTASPSEEGPHARAPVADQE